MVQRKVEKDLISSSKKEKFCYEKTKVIWGEVMTALSTINVSYKLFDAHQVIQCCTNSLIFFYK